jgi:hypothetical protein
MCLIGPGSANKLSAYVCRHFAVIYGYRVKGIWENGAELKYTHHMFSVETTLDIFNGVRNFILK